jgi:hypothetical protein
MRIIRVAVLVLAFVAVALITSRSSDASAQSAGQSSDAATRPPDSAKPRAVATMSELMIRVIYPTSDAVFYIGTRVPANDAEWADLQTKLLLLAESANLLMMPGRARDNDRWMADAALMLDAGQAAYRAARAKNVEALEALNDQLYQSCVQCHQHYRPGYGRRRP